MEKEELEDLIKEITADYPDEYVEELGEIADDSIVNAMRISYYVLAGVLAGVFGIALIVALFLPKRKLSSTSDDSTKSRDGPEDINEA